MQVSAPHGRQGWHIRLKASSGGSSSTDIVGIGCDDVSRGWVVVVIGDATFGSRDLGMRLGKLQDGDALHDPETICMLHSPQVL